jgi:hypothetical protein
MTVGSTAPGWRPWLRAFVVLDGIVLVLFLLLLVFVPPWWELAFVGAVLSGGLLVLVGRAFFALKHGAELFRQPPRSRDRGDGPG